MKEKKEIDYKKIIRPLDTCCTVLVKTDGEKTSGGLVLTTKTQEEDTESKSEGMLLECGDNSFQDILKPERRPKVGDNVKFVRYAGAKHKIKDTEEYIIRVMHDKDIFGVYYHENEE